MDNTIREKLARGERRVTRFLEDGSRVITWELQSDEYLAQEAKDAVMLKEFFASDAGRKYRPRVHG